MSVNPTNLHENNNHLTVASNAHNTIESLEKQAQDFFSVERTPLQFTMQRMGQLQISSSGRGRYNLKNYQNQESLTFVADKKRFETEFEQQENFVILPKKKKKYMSQIQNFFRIYPERKKGDYSIEKTINEINLKAEGKFFSNKPVLKKKKKFRS